MTRGPAESPVVKDDDLRARREAWYERQLVAAQHRHGRHWPEHSEWVKDYLREELRQRGGEGDR